jgi:hypothetical protein
MWHVPARREIHPSFQWGKLKKRDYLEDLGENGRIILKSIKKKEGSELQSFISGEAQVVDYNEDGHLASACINFGGFLDKLRISF